MLCPRALSLARGFLVHGSLVPALEQDSSESALKVTQRKYYAVPSVRARRDWLELSRAESSRGSRVAGLEYW